MTNVYHGYRATADEFRSITAITHGASTAAPATQSIPGQLTNHSKQGHILIMVKVLFQLRLIHNGHFE